METPKLIQEFKDKWAVMSFWEKVVTVFTLPILILLGALKIWGSWNGYRDDKLNKDTEKKYQDLQDQEDKIDNQISKVEGTLDQLEKDKERDIRRAEDQTADDFHNQRKYPRDDENS